ncbi:hypothetical protein TPHA_0G00390 [Tetrapisispora phaffii CBS 4417]|uniref:Major facilitator superfamily (MFS) profile domain-containing protein n=1 Tax=Tetrapisispora phaffii (strain ATCC 24235 / CBS 4417 / NBRC 1672 / NRRL Y-8282 / UCD 70-5) TaxID=1071381 RepID=G8BVE7_TETPH|nr:hypothetical protein TPHA_0G00390 [Tetrapisispora phaffii CBS 4417]CCE63875.1 hypothetical protein TPHA_0G00390 [Tetrapisispora phaffii CBS 4417]
MRVKREFLEASLDIKLLWASVFFRLLAYGMTNQVLVFFLTEIHMSDDKVGLFMSLTLVGDVFCSYVLTWYADSWGRRRVLVLGSFMMFLSGLVFSFSENFRVLLLFAIIGVISPSSNEVGPFRSIEESMIAHLTPHNKRPEIFAIHALVGSMGAALGALVSGSFMHFLRWLDLVETNLQAYKCVFLLYCAFALVKLVIMLLLSDKTETTGHHHEELSSAEALVNDEMAPLVEQAHHEEERSHSLSPETLSVLYRLLTIFMIDSLGSGFMTDSWMVYYYSKTFFMSSFALGALFFVCQIAMASSTLPSSIIARKLGPVRATLAVQIPAGIFTLIIPYCEKYLPLSITILILHFLTMAMDVTPRQILLTNLVRPTDLTRVMGVVNIGKTIARCVGPIFTGLIAKHGYLWLCFVISGCLVILADLILACSFLHIDKKIIRQMHS